MPRCCSGVNAYLVRAGKVEGSGGEGRELLMLDEEKGGRRCVAGVIALSCSTLLCCSSCRGWTRSGWTRSRVEGNVVSALAVLGMREWAEDRVVLGALSSGKRTDSALRRLITAFLLERIAPWKGI